MEKMELIDIDQAIERLISYKAAHGNKILVCIVDLDNGKTSRKRKTIQEGCAIIRKSKLLVLNEDNFFPHIMAFSNMTKQDDFLPQNGEIHDFLLCHEKNCKSKAEQAFEKVIGKHMFW